VIVLNGEPVEIPAGESLLVALERLGLSGESRGVAVAVDGEVVPRDRWGSLEMREHARVEVLAAMQGG
jgi:sulfur carrier protein